MDLQPLTCFLTCSPLISFPGDSDSKESSCNAGDLRSIPGLERYPEEGNGTPLLYSCLGNPRIKKPGGLQSLGFKVLDTTEQLTLFGKMFADLLKDPSEISLWN